MSVMIGSAWRHTMDYAPRGWRIGRCSACSLRFTWEPKRAPVACIDCGAPLRMTRRYVGDKWVIVQRSDVGFSHWKARGYRALQERAR